MKTYHSNTKNQIKELAEMFLNISLIDKNEKNLKDLEDEFEALFFKYDYFELKEVIKHLQKGKKKIFSVEYLKKTIDFILKYYVNLSYEQPATRIDRKDLEITSNKEKIKRKNKKILYDESLFK